MDTDDIDAAMPCCDYRDHSSGVCACPEHARTTLHPFGNLDPETLPWWEVMDAS